MCPLMFFNVNNLWNGVVNGLDDFLVVLSSKDATASENLASLGRSGHGVRSVVFLVTTVIPETIVGCLCRLVVNDLRFC